MRHFEIIGHALEAWFEIDFPPPFTGSVRLALVFTGKAVPCADFFFFNAGKNQLCYISQILPSTPK